jgi:hypothetical protein
LVLLHRCHDGSSLHAASRRGVETREVQKTGESVLEVLDGLRVEAVVDPASIFVFPPLEQ